jgi:hypothetical protein
VAAAPRAIDPAISSRVFDRAGFRLRVAAALAATLRFAAFDFFAARRAGLRVVLRAFDFAARLRFGDFFANARSLSSVALAKEDPFKCGPSS